MLTPDRFNRASRCWPEKATRALIHTGNACKCRRELVGNFMRNWSQIKATSWDGDLWSHAIREVTVEGINESKKISCSWLSKILNSSEQRSKNADIENEWSWSNDANNWMVARVGLNRKRRKYDCKSRSSCTQNWIDCSHCGGTWCVDFNNVSIADLQLSWNKKE